ncbi:MAG: TlpA family protein disulfide reductase [Desulfobulbaceae bacterium]|nr:TlpA family protein disulfide reductase [Desulfobulbaceae bacterium]
MIEKIFKFIVIALLVLAPASSFALSEGDSLPPFTTEDIDGNPVDLQEVIGKKPIMIVFWASWCPSCFFEVPKLNSLYDEFGPQGLEFYGVNVDQNDSVNQALKFMAKAKMRYPVIYDTGSVITNNYEIPGVPTIMIVNKKGEITFKKNYVPEFTQQSFKDINQ